MIPGIIGVPVAPPTIEWTMEQRLDLCSKTQYKILEHLCETAIRQKEEARATKRKFRGGWTYMRYNQRVKLASVRALKTLGLVEFCCEGHAGTDLVRISRQGVEFIEFVTGEEVLV